MCQIYQENISIVLNMAIDYLWDGVCEYGAEPLVRQLAAIEDVAISNNLYSVRIESELSMLREHCKVIDDAGFMECPQCAAKTGSPLLCESCLTNRERTHYLHEKAANMSKYAPVWQIALRLALTPLVHALRVGLVTCALMGWGRDVAREIWRDTK